MRREADWLRGLRWPFTLAALIGCRRVAKEVLENERNRLKRVPVTGLFKTNWMFSASRFDFFDLIDVKNDKNNYSNQLVVQNIVITSFSIIFSRSNNRFVA